MCYNQEILYAHSLKAINQYHKWDASFLFLLLTAAVDVKDIQPMPYISDHLEQDMFDVASNTVYLIV
jgi:hypothetical protein